MQWQLSSKRVLCCTIISMITSMPSTLTRGTITIQSMYQNALSQTCPVFKLNDWNQMHFCRHICWLASVLGIWMWCGNAAFGEMQLSPQNLVATCSFNLDFQVGGLEPDAFLPTHFVDYLDNLMSALEIWKCLEGPLSGKCYCLLRIWWHCVLAIWIFKLDYWNQKNFCQHIPLAVPTTSGPLFMEFQSVLENPYSIKYDCLLRLRCRRVSCNFDIWVAWLDQMHYCPHILFAILTSSCLFLEFESDLETPHSVKCDGILRLRCQFVLAISILKLDYWNKIVSCLQILLAICTTSCLILEFQSALKTLHSSKCNCLLRIW